MMKWKCDMISNAFPLHKTQRDIGWSTCCLDRGSTGRHFEDASTLQNKENNICCHLVIYLKTFVAKYFIASTINNIVRTVPTIVYDLILIPTHPVVLRLGIGIIYD